MTTGRTARGWVLAMALLAPTVFLATGARAQDTHYWRLKYGSTSTLLGGQVIGAPVDLGTSFYNPGGLALIRPGLAMDLQIYQLRDIRVVGGLPIRDVTQTEVRTVPSLFVISLPHLGENRFAVSLVTRQNSDLSLLALPTAPLPLPGLAEGTRIDTEAIYDESANDTWGGLSWARPLGSHLGLGATLYGAYRSQLNSLNATLVQQSPGGLVGTAFTERRYSYSDVRLIGKVGLAGRWERLSAGVTLAPPSLHVGGRGEASIFRGTSQITAATGFPDRVERVVLSGQHTMFHTPWDVGAGLSYDAGPVRLYGSLEWFAPVAFYDVIELPASITGSDRLTQEMKAVLNWGLALEYSLSERVALYANFARDGSARPEQTRSTLSLTSWDYWSAGAGVALTLGTASLVIALEYAWGAGPLRQVTDATLANSFSGAGVTDRYLVLSLALAVEGREEHAP